MTAPFLGYATVEGNANLDTLATNVANAVAVANAALPLIGGTLTGDLAFSTAGLGIKIPSGSNATIGEATMASGSVVVANTLATTTMRVFLSYRTITTAGHCGFLGLGTIIAGTSFTITSTNAADDAVVSYLIVDTP